MSDETKSESNAATGDNAKATASNDPRDMLSQLWNFVNNPLVANTALGAVLYKVIDPQGIKDALSELKRQQRKMAELLTDQNETIRSLRKQVLRLREEISGNEPEERDDAQPLKGLGKSKRRKNIFLD